MQLLPKQIKISSVRVLADGVISDRDWADGRLIPAVIIETKYRPDIFEYITAHVSQPPGDVETQWGTDFFKRKYVTLIVKSERPVNIEFGIYFELESSKNLIDAILQANGLYIMAGNEGDKVSDNLDKERILIEVPRTGFEIIWNKIFLKTMVKIYKKKGMNRKGAKEEAQNHITRVRELLKFRRNKINPNE